MQTEKTGYFLNAVRLNMSNNDERWYMYFFSSLSSGCLAVKKRGDKMIESTENTRSYRHRQKNKFIIPTASGKQV